MKNHLLIVFAYSSQRLYTGSCVASNCSITTCSGLGGLWCSCLWWTSSFDVVNDVCLGDSSSFACAWHQTDVDALLLGHKPDSWSGQSFTRKNGLITWRCCCELIANRLLCWGRWLTCRSLCLLWCSCCWSIWNCSLDFFHITFITLNLQQNMANWANIIVSKVDLCHCTSGCWWNLGYQLISENFTEVVIL